MQREDAVYLAAMLQEGGIDDATAEVAPWAEGEESWVVTFTPLGRDVPITIKDAEV